MITHDALGGAIASYLPGQRWFGSKDHLIKEVTIESMDLIRDEWPMLLSVQSDVTLDDDSDERYHVLLGLRPLGEPAVFLEGNAEAVLGEFQTDRGSAYGYDALRDPELGRLLFQAIAPQFVPVERVRPVGTEQSNTSLIYDDNYILKVYRRLPEGPNLDIEVTRALWNVGFTRIAEPLGEWEIKGTALGILQRFLSGGVEGWKLALTSLRDLLSQECDPAEAGGDFAAEAERLGETTAELHVALARAFGAERSDVSEWLAMMHDQLGNMNHPGVDKQRVAEVFETLRDVGDAGPAIRTHGDFHLGQVMRTDAGWYVLDFEGEPARAIDERRRPSSPLKDVSGMLRSLHYASMAALAESDHKDLKHAQRWESRNRQHFLDGYVAVAHSSGGILPSDTQSFETVLKVFEIDKAIYEIGYEMAHRPDWVGIPLSALHRLLA